MTDRAGDVFTKVMGAYVAATPPPPELPEIRSGRAVVGRPAFAFAAAFAVVVVIGVAVAMLSPFGNGSASDVSSGHNLAAVEWSSAVADPSRDFSFASVATDGQRLVAVGQIGASEANGTPNLATMWYSDDNGATWIEVMSSSFEPRSWRADEIEPTSTIAGVNDVVHGPDGFVAVGQLDGDGAVWVSEDGQAWELIDDPSLGGRGLQTLEDLVVGDGALLATGYSDSGTHAWTSTNGRDWVEVDLFATFPHPKAIGHAAGFTVFAPMGDSEAFWTSPDGINWDYRGPTDVEPDLVARNPVDGSFTAMGTAGAWTSTDGVAWTEIHMITEPDYANTLDPIRPDSGTMIWHDEWLIATDPDTGMWASTNGVAWSRFEWSGNGPDRPELASIEGQLIATGEGIWIGTPERP